MSMFWYEIIPFRTEYDDIPYGMNFSHVFPDVGIRTKQRACQNQNEARIRKYAE